MAILKSKPEPASYFVGLVLFLMGLCLVFAAVGCEAEPQSNRYLLPPESDCCDNPRCGCSDCSSCKAFKCCCVSWSDWKDSTCAATETDDERLTEAVEELNGNLVRMIEILDTIQRPEP